MNRLFLLVGALTAMLFAVPAAAIPIQYSVTNSTGFSASFTLDSNIELSPFANLEPGLFFVFDAPGTYSDGSTTAGLTFYDALNGGGMTILTKEGFTEASFVGPELFSGSLTEPTLLAFDAASFADYYDPSITYTVSAIASAAPEPATWGMLLLGFGIAGGAIRRRGESRPVAVRA